MSEETPVKKLFANGLHQYEPVWSDDPSSPNYVAEGDEVKITSETRWIPMCQKSAEKADIITNFVYNSIVQRLAGKIKRECEECAVLCFYEEMEQLDYLLISHIFPDTEA